MLNTQPPTRRGPRWTPTSTCCSLLFIVTADDLLPAKAGERREEASQTRRSSRSASPKRSWVSRRTAVPERSPPSIFGTCSHGVPGQAGYFKRRRRLVDTLEWLMSVFASQSPGFYDDLSARRLAPRWSAPAAARRSSAHSSLTPLTTDTAAATPASSGDSGCTRIFAPDGTPRAVTVASPKRDEREVALELLGAHPPPGAGDLDRRQGLRRESVRPGRRVTWTPRSSGPAAKTSPARGPHLAPIRQSIESIFWSCKSTLTLERHGARTLHGLRERILQRLLTLAAASQPQPPTRPANPSTRRLQRLTTVESII